MQATAPPDLPITGLILAGGRGRRMGSLDKGLVELSGRPMIDHVIDRLLPQVSRLLIVANRHLAEYARRGEVVTDRFEDFPGPLAGLHAGLSSMQTAWGLVVPVDAPLLPLDLAARLLARAHAGDLPLCCHDGQRPQPLFGLYRKEDATSMAAALQQGERTLMRWHDQAGTQWERWEDPDAFSNVNTPEDLETIRTGWRESPP